MSTSPATLPWHAGHPAVQRNVPLALLRSRRLQDPWHALQTIVGIAALPIAWASSRSESPKDCKPSHAMPTSCAYLVLLRFGQHAIPRLGESCVCKLARLHCLLGEFTIASRLASASLLGLEGVVSLHRNNIIIVTIPHMRAGREKKGRTYFPNIDISSYFLSES